MNTFLERGESMYQGFASVYDYLMTDTPYDSWYELLLKLIKDYQVKGKDVLDLACGTGQMTHRLSKSGFKAMGVDLSSQMLEQAQTKAFEQALKCRFINQDIRHLELFQQYDFIVSYCDGMNYMIEDEDLKGFLDSIHTYLKDEGYFFIEISSYYKLSQVLKQNTFTEVNPDVAYIWDNNFDSTTHILDFDLTLFVDKNGLYERFDESHKQRAFKQEDLKDLFRASGLDLMELLDSDTGEQVKETSERWLLVGRKINE